MSQELYRFILQAKTGGIFRGKTYRPYNPGSPKQFCNTPLAVPIILKNGRSVVNIGFVDFEISLDSIGSIDSFDSIGSIDFKGEPVIVLVYDMDPFCVAKSMVIITMIKYSTVNA